MDEKDNQVGIAIKGWEDPNLKVEKKIIKVVGVGGGGCNAVTDMYSEGLEGVTFAVCDTNKVSLNTSPVPFKLLLGRTGLGAGSNPEQGRKEAEITLEEIKNMYNDGTEMVFVTAGMGSGTGTGAAPLVASVARSMGILTIGIVTLPFYFEKRRKIYKALMGLEEMRKNVDALLIINNQQICNIYSNSEISMKESFMKADQVLCDATRSISELITITGNIDVDFRDVEATMRNGGGAIMAMGRASGQHRIEQAFENALNSPLLYGSDIGQAKRILFNIYASKEKPIYVNELEEVDAFMDTLNPNIDVIWGTADDDSLGDDVKVTILATGFENKLWDEQTIMDKDITDEEYLDEIIYKLYGKNRRKYKITAEDNQGEPTEQPKLIIQVGTEQIVDQIAASEITTPEESLVSALEEVPEEAINEVEEQDESKDNVEGEQQNTTIEVTTSKGFIVEMRKKFNQIIHDWIEDSKDN